MGSSRPPAFTPALEQCQPWLFLNTSLNEKPHYEGFFFFLFPCKSSHKLLINKRGYSQENQTKSLSYYLDHSQIIHHRHRPINAALSHTSQEGWLGAAKETKETLLKQPGYRCQSLALKKMNIILLK